MPGLIGWLLWTPLRLTIALILRAAIWTFQKPGRAAVVLAVAAFAVGSGYYLWFRNSSLASVDRIRVEGTTIQIDEINAAIASAAAGMTTLNVDAGALEDALAHFPTVAGVEVSADFPHEMTVTVIERTPVAVVSSGDRLIAVDGEGTVSRRRRRLRALGPADRGRIGSRDENLGRRADADRGDRRGARCPATSDRGFADGKW